MTYGRDILFKARTPLGFTVRVTQSQWTVITTIKHPVMAGCEEEVRIVLQEPGEIRRSKNDANVYLFYRSRHTRRWVCAVTKREDGSGFLITAYPTDAIKEGERIWPK